jgi:hypothetical protein
MVVWAATSCADSTSPGPVQTVRVALSLQVPAAVSQAETDALGSAFDRIDTYSVEVKDSVNGTMLARRTLSVVEAGPDTHTLDVELAQSTVGRVVLATVSGLDGGVELYRTAGYTRVQETPTPSPVVLPLRYTGPGLRGTVRGATGAGLGGVTVELFQGVTPFATVTTEPDGTYLFLPTTEGGVLTSGAYQVRPQPPSEFICPVLRSVTVSASSSIVASFTAQTTPCQVELLVVSGGDFDDTQAVAAVFAQTPDVTTETFFFVNQIPGLSYLNQFDVVLLLANGQFFESSTLGSEIKSYVDGGGNVVMTSFYWQNRSDSNLGSPGWGALEGIDPFVNPTAGRGGATYQAAVLGQITTGDVPTGDALVQGLSTLTSTGFRGGVEAAPGATVVARWSDGQPLIGYRVLPGGQRLVAISLFPASGAAAGGDTQALWENAVRWTGEAGGPGEAAPAQPPIFDSTLPSGSIAANAHTSQTITSGASTKTFDDFTLGTGRTIRRVQWQGIYCVPTVVASAPAPTASSFTVSIYGDANNLPDQAKVLATGNYAIGRVSEIYDSTIPNATCGAATPTAVPIYAYDVTLNTPFVAAPGVRYWLSVSAHTPDFTVFWGWRSGTATNGRSIQIGATGVPNVFTTDRAFSLVGS